MAEQLNIVFMGTPEFAVQSLDAIVQSKHNVVGVITSVDKPAGRGKKLKASAVKEYALANDLKLLQPEKLKNEDFLAELKSLNADIFVVVAFRMLPEVVWNMPPLGTFNLHASLLPQYRGAAPINYAIINGETESGVTTFFLDKQIDTGRIILQEKCAISKTDDAGDLHDRLMEIGSKLVVKTLNLVARGDYKTKEQLESTQNIKELKSAPKIFKEDCRINFEQDVETCYNHIRGLSPFPGAFTELISPEGKVFLLKIFKTEITNRIADVGSIHSDEKDSLEISCKNGSLKIHQLQLQGKKRMQTADLLRGFTIDDNWSVKRIILT
jgi:methionyl-tRNA formyltransferase